MYTYPMLGKDEKDKKNYKNKLSSILMMYNL